ncbi:MAG TPA: YCF48-related protein [Solimonas sp.]|nr:YCF48-related protein [Solimonas sp.]
MSSIRKMLLQAVPAIAVIALAHGAWAQTPPAETAPAAEPAAEAPADAAPAEGEAAAEPAAEPAAAPAAPAAPAKPRPAEMAPLTPRRELLDVTKVGDHLVAVGDRGGIIISTNGADWTQVASPVRAALTAVGFADDKNGWAVGHDATILHTADGGKTWALQNFAAELEKPFLDVLVLDAQHALAVGAYGLFYKTDDGEHWAEVDAPAIRADEVHFNGIAKLNDGSLFIAGEQGMLGLSTDGGATWTKLTSPYDASLFGVLPYGDKGAIIFGLRGNAYLSQDAKAGNWTKLDTQTVASLFGGALMPDGRIVLVGLNGAVLAVDPNGSNVRSLRVPVKETDKAGREKLKDLSSALSAAIPFGSGVLVVGEEGVQRLAGLQ